MEKIKGKWNFNNDDIKTIIRNYIDDDMSISEISKKYDIHRQIIRELLINNNVQLREQYKEPSEEEIKNIIYYYEALDYSLQDIREIFDVGEKMLNRILKENNVNKHTQIMKGYNLNEVEKIYKMYLNSTSQSSIAKMYGLNRVAISKYLLIYHVYVNKENLGINELSIYDIRDIYVYYKKKKNTNELSLSKNISKEMLDKIYSIFSNTTEDFTHGTRWTYSVNENYFDNIDTPNKAYTLGFIFADGCNYNRYYDLTIGLQYSDDGLIKDILNDMGSTHPIRYYERGYFDGYKSKDIARVDITNKRISNRLIELGVIPNKTLVMDFPDYLDENLISHFVRGYFDGDGCLPYNPNKYYCINFTSGSELFLDKLNEVIQKYTGYKMSKYKVKDKNIYRISATSKTSSKVILDWMYKDSDLKLKRKYDLYLLKFYGINNYTYSD